MKGIIGIIVGIIVVILIIIGFTAAEDEKDQNLGRVYFGITDQTADISSVSEIEMEVEKIEVKSQAEGWTTVSSDSKTYALLQLKADGKIELYDSAELEAGAYDQVRVTLGDVVVDNTTEGEVKAFLPSNEITFDVDVVVEKGQDSHVTLDFIADQSLHVSTTGEYVFAPVVEVESRSNTTVEVGSGNAMTVSGGTVDSKVSVGVDLDGTAKSGFKLDTSSGLEVDTSSENKTMFKLNGQTFIKGSAGNGASVETDSSGSVETNNGASVETDADADVNIGL